MSDSSEYTDSKQVQVPVPYPVLPDQDTMKQICEMLITDAQKWRISVLAGLIFLLLSSPLIYQLTSSIGDCVGLNIANGSCPTTFGLLLHTAVFVLVTRLLMK